ncbi:MAG: AI-2E family transporter YdiK [Desulfuromonadales bacterium]|nr:AI-2E family transporter YdiK [Desulfuromonadales bacterium]
MSPPRDLPGIVLGIIAICLLMASAFWILRPFLLPLVWATMIAVATWPLLLGMQKWLRNSRTLAVLVMTVTQLLILILPLALAVMTILQNADAMKNWIRALSAEGLPAPPAWVGTLPLVGEKAAAMWTQAAAGGPEGLSAQLTPYVQKALAWFVNNAGSAGMIIVQLLLTLILTAILYAKGETAALGIRLFFRRLVGDQGEQMVVLAGQSIRAVAMGIVVTALLQSLLGGIGLWIAGIPGVALLTAVMFLLAIVQIGVVPVLAVAVIWLFYKDVTFWAVFLLVWTVVVGSVDNVIRPILIKRGADLPMLLILSGVIGGLVAFGIIGLFVGPVVLAVTYTLLKNWVLREVDGGSSA